MFCSFYSSSDRSIDPTDPAQIYSLYFLCQRFISGCRRIRASRAGRDQYYKTIFAMIELP